MQSGFRQRVNQREDVEKPTAGAAQAAKKKQVGQKEADALIGVDAAIR